MADLYTAVVRPLVFGLGLDPEWLHGYLIERLAWLGQPPAAPSPLGLTPPQTWLSQQLRVQQQALAQRLWGVEFPNPLGLAAGFDKDGQACRAWSLMGFGFAELGTVTAQAQPGNPKPRLFRLPQDRAALNRMGFNNQGAAAMAQRLAQLWSTQRSPIPLGINLGKSKVTPLEQAPQDYLHSFRLLYPWGDYFVVNVSSPNTPGLRSLQARDQLEPILAALQGANLDHKPLLVKIAPDLDWAAIATVIELVRQYNLAGIIATNTTIQRDQLQTRTLRPTGEAVTEAPGGISGAPLRQRSTAVIRFIWQQSQGQVPIIGVGGIFNGDDAWEKITAGASLLQVYTGWIYEGPWMVRRTLEGLLGHLQAHGLTTITEAVGLCARS